ncbi:PTS lactose transporter subunit IIB, partial [Bacillus cereus]
KDIICNLEDGNRTVAGLTNILDLNEIKEALQKHLM